ncbi:hypothetical protein HDC92_002555 [Pedobacter sp. AK017]|uniref:putative nucleotide-diphospho-sugar transferase n=1 Tax=Pedobacter sp. AK017 TaxID=2723073 RepID=UPI00161DA6D5|nr:putative nucleotide-diphospho-sugar transferase [Pedobacter sp. AK017]MBB5438874.1 hypothetical protein [Pedobacter sp. AK017]
MLSIKKSLVFRIPFIYKQILSLSKPKKTTVGGSAGISMLMFCGLNQLELLEQSLYSVYRKFENLPTVHLFTDQDLDSRICQNKLHWFPSAKLRIISAADCIRYHLNKGDSLLANFANLNPMGLKLAAISQLTDQGLSLLYCDTDVLWHKDPSPVFSAFLTNDSLTLSLSEDFQPSYDQHMIDKAELNILSDRPYYCAGMLFIKRFTPESKVHIQRLLEIAVKNSNHFTEQTVLAYLQKVGGHKSLAKHQFAIILEDKYKLIPERRPLLIARHYVGPVRHQFWRDAFFMRLGLL